MAIERRITTTAAFAVRSAQRVARKFLPANEQRFHRRCGCCRTNILFASECARADERERMRSERCDARKRA
jgi:hypothetical protein